MKKEINMWLLILCLTVFEAKSAENTLKQESLETLKQVEKCLPYISSELKLKKINCEEYSMIMKFLIVPNTGFVRKFYNDRDLYFILSLRGGSKIRLVSGEKYFIFYFSPKKKSIKVKDNVIFDVGIAYFCDPDTGKIKGYVM